MISAHIAAQTEERLNAVAILAEYTNKNALTIRAKWPDDKRKTNNYLSFDR
jgi:hypothetical protein